MYSGKIAVPPGGGGIVLTKTICGIPTWLLEGPLHYRKLFPNRWTLNQAYIECSFKFILN
jgi:hypothetical protein